MAAWASQRQRRLGSFRNWRCRKLRPPTRTFDQQLTLDAGGRTVELIEVGPAHTLGDTFVWVPDVRVLFAADIVFNGVTPIMWAGPVEGWLTALDTAAALAPAR